jgi:hypothetical protein
VQANKLFIQEMTRKWGRCNPKSRNIRLNTQLAQKPKCCLEYDVLHELAHLRVPSHGEEFQRVAGFSPSRLARTSSVAEQLAYSACLIRRGALQISLGESWAIELYLPD